MFFEGSEKKLEVVVKARQPSLRRFGRPFWDNMVTAANAEILSHLSNEYCDAYLLSESSLFVWDDRFLMLTCGTTTLVDSALLFIEHQGIKGVDFLIYQRKNEYHSQLQKSSLNEDLRRLRLCLPMRAYQLGHLDSHHHYLAHYDNPYQPQTADHTNELLMYHINGDVADYLRSDGQTPQGVRERLQLARLLPGFALDDFVFSPCGYSVNALRGTDYATIHITPEQNSSYVSFESNLDLGGEYRFIIDGLLEILKPHSWDTVGFNSETRVSTANQACYVEQCEVMLNCGYKVQFSHHKANNNTVLPVLSL